MRPRSFSRDMRSILRNGDRSRDRSRGDRVNEKRSGSKDEKKEYKNCIGCKCEDCKKMRQSAKEMNVQLCDGFELNEEILELQIENNKLLLEYTHLASSYRIEDLAKSKLNMYIPKDIDIVHIR